MSKTTKTVIVLAIITAALFGLYKHNLIKPTTKVNDEKNMVVNKADKKNTDEKSENDSIIKIVNPASYFCIEQSGLPEIKDQKAYCKLSNGDSVELWENFYANTKEQNKDIASSKDLMEKNEDLNVIGDKIVGYYDVKNGKIGKLHTTKYTENYSADIQKIVDYVEKVMPEKYYKQIRYIEVAISKMEKMDAYAAQINKKNDTWILSINLPRTIKDGKIIDNFYPVLVHELTHVEGLNGEQMDANAKNTYVAGEGTLKTDSPLNQFYKKFWEEKGKEYTELGVEKTYKKYPNDFVNEYSSTNVIEDFAESYAYFVTGKPIESGDESGLAKQKFEFFKQFPKLMELKEDYVNRVK